MFLGIFLVAAIGIGVAMFATHGFMKSGNSESWDDRSSNGIESYTYMEHHSDGSEMNLIFEELYGKYAAVMKYTGPTGDAYFHTHLLSDSETVKFLSRIEDYQLSDDEVADDTAWTKGVLVVGNKKSSIAYTISPVDITGLGLTDPWSDKIDTIVSKPDGLEYMSVVGMRKVSNAKNETELYAFMDMVNDELSDLTDNKKPSSLTVDAEGKTDKVYKMTVRFVGETEPSYFVITPNGYVAKMQSNDK